MFVDGLLAEVQRPMVTLLDSATLIEAAELLNNGTDLVLVCEISGILRGVVSKTDIATR